MKKLLWLIIFLPTLTFGQAHSVNITSGSISNIGQVVRVDTTVLKEGSEYCRHYLVSRNAEQQERGSVYAVYHLPQCEPETEDYFICCKCLRHLKIITHWECVTVWRYSDLVKSLEAKNRRP